jgi:GTP-binding protein Era
VSAVHRCGTVGMAGRPNVGKSTLVNRLLGEKLSIVSPRPQTTRHLITGILTTADCQYVLVDSPGYQTRHQNALNRTLNRRASEAARDTDVTALVIDASRFGEEDRQVLARIPEQNKVVAVANKIDLLPHQDALLPLFERLAAQREFVALVPVSARTGRNLDRLLEVLREQLPESPAAYPRDQLTDRDERFFAAEFLREKLFLALGEELPYRCEVSIESFKEEGRLRRIEATIWVERDSQKPIVIGEGGATLKSVSTAARKDLERMYGGKVYLGVWVKVRRGWSDDRAMLRKLGHA